MASKLGDYCDFQEGYVNPSQHHPEYFDGDVKWIRAVDLNNGFVYNTTRTLTSTGFRSAGKSALLFEPDTIVISKSGTIGRLGIIKDYMCGNRATINIRPKHNCDLYFVFYFLRSIQQHLGDLAVGSVQKNLYVSILENIEVAFPDLDTQRKIGQFMLMFDSKIETNNKINDNLQQQAMALYASMFLDNPALESTAGTLKDIADITMGQSPSGSSYNEDGNGEVFYQGRAEFGYRFPTRRLYTIEPKRMAEAGDVLLSVRAPVGDLNVAYERCCIGRGLGAIHSRNGYQSFVLYTMFALRPQLDIYNGEGTVFGSINRSALNDMPIDIPSEDAIAAFEAVVRPMDNMIRTNYEENCRLQELRDALLPRIMSGEVDVSDIDF